MFGYACNETKELMPLAISLAQKLAKQLTAVRKDGTLSYLRPDGKTQVTVEYEGDTPVRVDTVVVSTQHDEKVTLEQIRKDMVEYHKANHSCRAFRRKHKIFHQPDRQVCNRRPCRRFRSYRQKDYS